VSVELGHGDWRAQFLPELGMLGASVAYRGGELLSLPGGIEAYRNGHTVGLPLLAPWANRLARRRFRVEGAEVDLESAKGIHFDEHGLPIHGTMTAQPAWEVVRQEPRRLTARFAYDTPELLAAFPFPHELEIDVELDGGVRIGTALTATGDRTVPVSFGWHPYFRVRDHRGSIVALPARRHLELDERGIPTGRESAEQPSRAPLGESVHDDLYALGDDRAFALDAFVIHFGDRYPYAQLYAPAGSDFVAIEPMTAPTNALVGGGYPLVRPGERFEAEFSISAGEGGETTAALGD
jgi:aldose 1-epimerase